MSESKRAWPSYFDEGEKTQLEQILQKVTTAILKSLDGGFGSIDSELAPLRKMRALYQKMYDTPPMAWPPVNYGHIGTGLDRYEVVLNQYLNFKTPITSRDFDHEARRLRSQGDTLLSEYGDELRRFVSLATAFDTSKTEGQLKQFNQKILTAEGELKQLVYQAKVSKESTEKMEKDARQAYELIINSLGGFGVSDQAKFFKTASFTSGVLTVVWIAATVGLIVKSIGICTEMMDLLSIHTIEVNNVQVRMETADYIASAAPRIVIFILLYFSIIWCARMANASLHNFVVNRHRVNALDTFHSFVKATDDKDVQNAILLQATQTIFSHQSSGFIKDESPSVENSKIIEIIKSVRGKSDLPKAQ